MHIYIIEDNLKFRADLVTLIEDMYNPFLFGDWKIKTITNIFSMDTLDIQNDSIFFLDIDLKSSINGLDIGTEIRKRNSKCYILFLTSYPDFGREMINSNIYPTAYLIKTADKAILSSEIFTALSNIQAELKKQRETGKQVILTNQKKPIAFHLDDILYITTVAGMKNTLLITTIYEESFIDGKISKIKQKFDLPAFYNELKSYIIHVNMIKSINQSIGFIYFQNGSILELNTPSARKLLAHFKEKGGL
ncbi:hypothetical protein HB825_13645 [Listeria booriae]|uniref:HTH LytTR-type domain-containing protein n=2 Tax=Listeria TaxID=1637 RepID=A0A842AGV9_9LIST|nr:MULTISPECIES: LytTR family transcriptional regulator DNA-binding domain-containing protein [Listeria]MBC1401020.1 hypothetical protein [Listeria booriae]MBC1435934.1 hypothetical protein [Listeria rocourtiae]MBC1617153.1 hypothetical protein [Listeria booriae]MBC1936419.1 hypothetical protein [Listeria grandensis]MBC2258694.1 hypothetical protein [Listeria booriae]